MDLLSMLMNAKVRTVDGSDLGEVIGVHFALGRMTITIDLELEDEDPDDGEKEDIPEDDASKMEFPRLAAMGKKVGKDGING